MTAVSDGDDMTDDLFVDKVETLSRATARLSFDPYVDIDWDAPENAFDGNDPRWQLDPDTAPLAATDWYAEQPLKRRIDMGRWITANTSQGRTIQFEMMLIRGVAHYAGSCRIVPIRCFGICCTRLIDECNHIQMFQEFINRTGEDVPGMRRCSRFIGPIVGFLGGYASIFHFIGVLCGEQPAALSTDTACIGARPQVPPLLNKITYIHLAEEARHITFADDYLAERMQHSGRFRRAAYAILSSRSFSGG